MGIFSFMDGFRNGQNGTPPEPPPQRSDFYLPPDSSVRDFENRLLRARSEPLSILRQRFMGGRCVSADVHNEQTGGTYHVTAESCDCEDFKKLRQPCKHIIFFSLKAGDFSRYEKPIPLPPPKYNGDNFIPFYGRYYSGPPTGIGWCTSPPSPLASPCCRSAPPAHPGFSPRPCSGYSGFLCNCSALSPG